MRILLFSLLLMSLSLTGCGFQLRGSGDFNLDVDSVSIAGSNSQSEFQQALEAAIEGLGIPQVAAAEAEYLIDIENESTTRRSVASSGDITASEYELRVEVTFSVLDQAGVELIEPTRLFSERIYTFDRNNLVGNSEEEAQLATEMRRDLAGQLIRRLSASLRGKAKSSTDVTNPG